MKSAAMVAAALVLTGCSKESVVLIAVIEAPAGFARQERITSLTARFDDMDACIGAANDIQITARAKSKWEAETYCQRTTTARSLTQWIRKLSSSLD